MKSAGGGLEVAVVGGGPAGVSVAYHLARLNRRVLIIERSVFPREKACGDGLTRRSLRLVGNWQFTPRSEFRRLNCERVLLELGVADGHHPDDLAASHPRGDGLNRRPPV